MSAVRRIVRRIVRMERSIDVRSALWAFTSVRSFIERTGGEASLLNAQCALPAASATSFFIDPNEQCATQTGE